MISAVVIEFDRSSQRVDDRSNETKIIRFLRGIVARDNEVAVAILDRGAMILAISEQISHLCPAVISEPQSITATVNPSKAAGADRRATTSAGLTQLNAAARGSE